MDASEWKKLLGDWKQRVAAYQTAQYVKASHLEKLHYRLGVPATIFAAVAGTTAFTNLTKDTFSFKAQIIVVTVSVIAAVLTAVQTFVNYGQRAEKSRAVSNQFGGVRKEIDVLENFPPSSDQEMQAKLLALNKEITDISKDAPIIDAPRRQDYGGGGPSMIMLHR